MTREQCRSAIVGPAAVCGFKIADDARPTGCSTISLRLRRGTIAARATSSIASARRADQLPLLQYCLNRMWVRARGTMRADAPIVLTLADYERIGGLGGALNAHAE